MGEMFGKYLKKIREDRKMTLREVEGEARISNAYLSQVERGIREVPTLKVLARLAKAYGIQLSDLTSKAEEEMSGQKSNQGQAPAPDTEFICRGYEDLSEGKKKELKSFLQYLKDKG
jgi:transcriptional regulator with XRE-family HTH domain